jgi:predicted negative regulator of RcsB-dependent stress response
MSRRITRKMLKEDEFVSTMDRVMQWMSEFWRPVVFAFCGLVVVILLWWVAGAWSGSRAEKASLALNQAVTLLGSDQEGEASDPAAAESQLREVIERFGGTAQGDIARLYVARIELDRGDVDSAREHLLRLVERSSDTALGQLAMLDLIHLKIASGQSAEAASELQAMVAGTDQRLPRDAALYELALLLEREERAEEARTHLQQLVDEFPESPYRFAAQQRLGELG